MNNILNCFRESILSINKNKRAQNYEQFIDSRTGLGKSGTIWEGMTLGQILGESQRFPRMSFLYEFEEQASPYIGYGGGASPSVG